MTDNVTPFPPPETAEPTRTIWVCACGCTAMYAHADGRIECQACERVCREDLGDWRKRLPPEPEDAPELDGNSFKTVTSLSVAHFYQRRLKDDNQQAIAVICLYEDGGMSTYLEKVVDIAWLRKKMAQGADRLVDMMMPKEIPNG